MQIISSLIWIWKTQYKVPSLFQSPSCESHAGFICYSRKKKAYVWVKFQKLIFTRTFWCWPPVRGFRTVWWAYQLVGEPRHHISPQDDPPARLRASPSPPSPAEMHTMTKTTNTLNKHNHRSPCAWDGECSYQCPAGVTTGLETTLWTIRKWLRHYWFVCMTFCKLTSH